MAFTKNCHKPCPSCGLTSGLGCFYYEIVNDLSDMNKTPEGPAMTIDCRKVSYTCYRRTDDGI